MSKEEKKGGNQDGVQTKRINNMTRYGKPIKNTRRRDPRYFLNEGLSGGYTEVDRLGDEDEKRAASSLKPKQYTFANIYDEYPTLIVKDETGVAYLSRASSRDPNKNEDLILKDLKPNGYEGVAITGPNSHLREGEQ